MSESTNFFLLRNLARVARERMSKTPLRPLLTSAFVLLSFIPLLVGGGIGWQRLQAAQQVDATQRVEALVANQRSRLEIEMGEQQVAFSRLLSDQILTEPSLTSNGLREVIDLYANELVSLTLFDPSGTLRLSTDSSMTDRIDGISFADDEADISIGRIRTRSDRPVHQMIDRVIDDGKVVGWLLAEYETAAFRSAIGDFTALGGTGETFVVTSAEVSAESSSGDESSADAVLLLFDSRSADRGTTWEGIDDSALPIARAAAGRATTSFGLIDHRGAEVVAATQTLEAAGWGIVVQQDVDEALAASQDFRAALLVGLLMGFGLVLVMGWWVGRRVTRPLTALRDVANSVAAGDLSQRAQVKSSDEIGELSRAFNIMTNELVANAEREASRTVALEHSNQRLVETETRTQTILETAAEGIIETDRLGVITAVNAAAEQIFGGDARRLIGESVNELIVMPLSGVLGHAFMAAEEAGGTGLEVSIRRFDGTLLPTHLTVSRLSVDHEVAFTGLIRDISERVAFQRELEYQANHDALTGLPNRNVLAAELDQALLRSAESLAPLALLFLDLDRFKQVNDTLGHQAGDELLCQVTSRSRNALRPNDLLSRFGGDEFVILAEGLRGEADALALGERVRLALDEPFIIEGQEVFTSVSVGIVVASGGDLDAEELLGDADNAMYRAKDTGRNRIEIFDAGMREEVAQSHDLDMALRKASGNDELRFAYQPVIDVDSGEVAFVEALARWDRPGYGPVAPDQFIEMAEQSGLISTLGPKLLAMAVEQLKEWNTDHVEAPLSMSVNVSSQQLTQLDFVDRLKELLDDSGIDPASLILEMTETAVVRDLDIVRENLEASRRLGVVVAVDDFGSGYSSLGYLQELPIDVLKMDRMLVDGIEDKSDTSIVDMVVTMCTSMGVTIVAEGVETAPQFAKLRDIGCEQIQGYVIARPMDPEQLEETVWHNRQKANLLPEGIETRSKQS